MSENVVQAYYNPVSHYAGVEATLTALINGVEVTVMTLQNFSFKEQQALEEVYWTGDFRPVDLAVGLRTYEWEAEVKRINSGIFEPVPVLTPSAAKKSYKTVIGNVTYKSLLDMKFTHMVVIWPERSGYQPMLKFKRPRISNVEGSFALDETAVGRKISGKAMGLEGNT